MPMRRAETLRKEIVMSNQVAMTEAEFENELAFSHYGGQGSALEDVAGRARMRAGEHFAAGNDELAKIWRDVANWLVQEGKDARAEQKKFAKPSQSA